MQSYSYFRPWQRIPQPAASRAQAASVAKTVQEIQDILAQMHQKLQDKYALLQQQAEDFVDVAMALETAVVSMAIFYVR
ncbi:hypothetical protein LTR08_000318 [Meristemomyces frigidus]|nr:hypothetical protein LTR08_000318 [Meristemomyces frigidus]